MQNPALAALIAEQKATSFIDPSTASDEDALGILIAHHLEWDGLGILMVAASALEDANFHTESAAVTAMVEAMTKEVEAA